MARCFPPPAVSGACLALGALLAPGAGAQPPADAGASCVHDTLTARGVAAMVAESFLTDETPEETLDDARLHLADAVGSCVQDRGLSESQSAAARDLGLYGVSLDFLADRLKAGGASAGAVAGVRTVIGEFSAAEIDRFFEDDWRSDLAFMSRVKAALLSKGLPDVEPGLTTAFDMIELEARLKQAAYLFRLSSGAP